MKWTGILAGMLAAGLAMGAWAEIQGRVSYSGARAKLDASSVEAVGWDLKEDELVSLASGAELELIFGPKWWQYFYIEGYSTTGLIPDTLGSGDDDISLYLFAFLFGLPGEKLPSIKISSIQFTATAFRDGDTPVYEDGQLLEIGDEFDVGLTYTTYLAIWTFLPPDLEEGEKPTSFFQYGVGAAHLKYLGVLQEYQEDGSRPDEVYAGETRDGWGFEVYSHIQYGTMEVFENTDLSLGAHVEIAMLDVGAMMKVGYEAALEITPEKNLSIKPYVGGYFWPFLNWEDDFGTAESDFGYQYGVQLNYYW